MGCVCSKMFGDRDACLDRELVILIVISVLVTGILHSGSVATVNLQTHRWRYWGWRRKDAVVALCQHVQVWRRRVRSISCTVKNDCVVAIPGPSVHLSKTVFNPRAV